MISETYSKKIDSCLKALAQLEIKADSLFEKYGNNQMSDSEILKKDLFNSVLNKIRFTLLFGK